MIPWNYCHNGLLKLKYRPDPVPEEAVEPEEEAKQPEKNNTTASDSENSTDEIEKPEKNNTTVEEPNIPVEDPEEPE